MPNVHFFIFDGTPHIFRHSLAPGSEGEWLWSGYKKNGDRLLLVDEGRVALAGRWVERVRRMAAIDSLQPVGRQNFSAQHVFPDG